MGHTITQCQNDIFLIAQSRLIDGVFQRITPCFIAIRTDPIDILICDHSQRAIFAVADHRDDLLCFFHAGKHTVCMFFAFFRIDIKQHHTANGRNIRRIQIADCKSPAVIRNIGTKRIYPIAFFHTFFQQCAFCVINANPIGFSILCN